MLTLISAKLATVEELFKYKSENFKLNMFPGYSFDQWGIKAHNRPWIDDVGKFKKGQKIIEVGGAYSTLPEYLAKKYKLEAWVGDDFGLKNNENTWSRWGNPKNNINANQNTKYIFEPFGIYSDKYPDGYFDRIFSVSTLEHIDYKNRVDVFKDMNRCTKRFGMQIHTIDVGSTSIKNCLLSTIADRVPYINIFSNHLISEFKLWKNIISASGIKVDTKFPQPYELMDRSVLVESPDVVYKYYPPNNAVKSYIPAASLLLIIVDK